ncbi:glutathione S-transferase [Blastomonas aquatica]|uniref:Glutathione S-transferase n=1 Tax=Blastomonas aquatica TaxID=1510276 RepID=A0ABQ1JNV9_9SPHN|nr:glutathione S-transferase [Blastomonas aquatica]GGB70841.1 glutathione S-transferase [Blastomonas aquatica]
MTDLPILYSFRRCPYAMRVRMALLVSGQQVELREVVLRAKPQALLDASPKATVPVLVLANGDVIDQSIDIMRWALQHKDPECWLAGDDADLISANDGPFKHHLDRYKYPSRYDEDPLAHRQAGLAHLVLLEQRLASHDFLSGPDRALVDIALFPFVRQFAATDAAWFAAQALPGVQRWLAELMQSDLFTAAMLRLAPWQPGDDATIFASH